MYAIRPSSHRGFANHGWLQSYHSFSFASYHDAQHMGFGVLRVINEDWIAAGQGFGTHSHQNMEIVTYVCEGALAHKDSMGNVESIPAGDVQRMSAGTGVSHSEFNHSTTDAVHLLQIWLLPNAASHNIVPSYEQKQFTAVQKQGRLQLIASPFADLNERHQAITIHANALLYATLLSGRDEVILPIANGHKIYLHVISGHVLVNGVALETGDAIKLWEESEIHVVHKTAPENVELKTQSAELLVFNLF